MTSTPASTSSSSLVREYRKGNWTIEETLILITAKKMDDERRMKSSSSPESLAAQCCRVGGELRWKWVENYCWERGCHRSQNQCNDKWDNLLRDYKKLRDYNSKSGDPSYWKMGKHERKDRNLPSKMALEVFEALNEVVEKRYMQRGIGSTVAPVAATRVVPPPVLIAVRAQPLPEQSEPPVAAEVPPAVSEKQWRKKRRKVGEIGASIEHGGLIMAKAMRSREEKQERRHREAMEIEGRRVEVEETKNEVNRKGMENLVTAVTNLSAAIQSLVSGGAP